MNRYSSPSQAAQDLMSLIEDEATELGAVVKLEKKEKRSRSNDAVVSAKLDEFTFRISLQWLRDDSVKQSGGRLGQAYIETEWELRLEPEAQSIPDPVSVRLAHLPIRSRNAKTRSSGDSG